MGLAFDEVLLGAEHEPVLLSEEAKPVAQLQDEIAHASNQPGCKIAFLHGAADPQKLEVIAALEGFLRLLSEVLRQGRREIVRFALPA